MRTWIVLLLLLWQWPVPVWHAHGRADDGVACPQLAEHVRDMHPQADACEGCWFFDWHCHWILPASLQSTDPTGTRPGVEAVPSETIPGGAELSLPSRAAVLGSVALDGVSPARRACDRGRDCAPTGFFATFAPRLSLPQRLSVHLC